MLSCYLFVCLFLFFYFSAFSRAASRPDLTSVKIPALALSLLVLLSLPDRPVQPLGFSHELSNILTFIKCLVVYSASLPTLHLLFPISLQNKIVHSFFGWRN